MEINYINFKSDCEEIIYPYLRRYGYTLDDSISEDYVNFYRNSYCLVEISMLENFPYIGVSADFLTLNSKRIKRSVLDKYLKINYKDDNKFYKEFVVENNLNDYRTQMKYAVAMMEKFYQPVLTGEIKIDDIC